MMKRSMRAALASGWVFLALRVWAAEPVVFEDTFEGGMKEGWSWLREEAAAHRVRDGALEVRVLPGNMWGGANDARNVLIRPAPDPADGPVEVIARVENHPTEQWEQVDLVWYYADSHMVKIGQERVDGQLSVVMGREEGDRTRTLAIVPLKTAEVSLRLWVRGDRIVGSFKPQGAERWIRAGECDLPGEESPKVSVQVYQGTTAVERWARVFQVTVRQPAEALGVDEARGPDVPPETPSQRDRRHAEVKQRRANLPILVHRGATAFAPENTVAALTAALDKGADGVEFDIRRSRDGIFYLFHDDTLERMTDRTGPVKDLDYAALRECRLKGGGKGEVIPRLEEALALARRRAALLHLDVKEPGLEPELIALLDRYDVWDHLVVVNDYNADRIRADARCRQLNYKGWLPQDSPPNWTAIDTFLARPGAMIFCKDDPTLAVKARERLSQ